MLHNLPAEPMRQNYAAYTPEDFGVWRILYERQMAQLPPIASRAYLDGMKNVQFSADKIPNFEETNRLLKPLTGWEIFVVPGLIPNRPFFELMQA
ncbi:MAG: phenylalanine-4-hydroxylase, partial [Cytophagaceae bacterium]|nr:phenylalanine-4-hydroxylase [Cytophagaceae bacterium]